MAKFREQMVGLFDRYVVEVGSDPISLDEVADWALSRGLYHATPRDIRKIFKQDLADSLRQDKRFDGKRWYRAKHSVRTSIGGVQLSLWADIDKNASQTFMQKSVAQRRRGVANDCFQLKQDVDHYNEANTDQPQLTLPLDFTDDVAEMEAAENRDEGSGEEA